MAMTFVCSSCDEPQEEVVARFCKPCGRSYIAGYDCPCGHSDVDPPGKEWGHHPHESDSAPSAPEQP